MIHKNIIETIVGAIVICIALWAAISAYRANTTSDLTKSDSYLLQANFDSADGISVGSAVKISGVRIGKVVKQSLDPSTYEAHIEMLIHKEIKLPSDTSAEIITTGLVGEKYVSLVPGSSITALENGATVAFTQSAMSIEGLIGKFVLGAAGSSSSHKKNEACSSQR